MKFQHFFPVVLLMLSINTFGQYNTSCEGKPELYFYGYKDIEKLVQNNKANNDVLSVVNTYAYYIDSRALVFMDKALKEIKTDNVPTYNGVNVHFVTYQNKYSPNEGNFQSRIAFTIAKKDGATGKIKMFYEAFRKFHGGLNVSEKNYYRYDEINKGAACYGNCDSVVTNWLNLRFGSKLSKLPFQYNEPTGLLFPTKPELKARSGRHHSKHGHESNNSQTMSIFMNAGKISNLSGFLTQNVQTLTDYPVVGVYYMSYNKIVAENQKDEKQTTVIFVPMRMFNGHFVPDPCAYLDYREKNKASILSENHGELCPDGCPEEGN